MDMRALMKQAQQMQAKMAKAQKELEGKEITAEVAGGQIKVTMNGKHKVSNIEIAPESVDPDDVEFLQDLIASAVNEAVSQVDAMVEKDMGSATGGMNIPGMPGM
ncbi:MAG: YbaB/EbfC family nucleoid-associated protein [bacterium]|nr:YbaB/EbfC family nucleoid-associated protein [bacterium]